MSHWFTMVSVTMKQILLNVFMMVETVVDLLFLVSPLAFSLKCRMENMLIASVPGLQII